MMQQVGLCCAGKPRFKKDDEVIEKETDRSAWKPLKVIAVQWYANAWFCIVRPSGSSDSKKVNEAFLDRW